MQAVHSVNSICNCKCYVWAASVCSSIHFKQRRVVVLLLLLLPLLMVDICTYIRIYLCMFFFVLRVTMENMRTTTHLTDWRVHTYGLIYCIVLWIQIKLIQCKFALFIHTFAAGASQFDGKHKRYQTQNSICLWRIENYHSVLNSSFSPDFVQFPINPNYLLIISWDKKVKINVCISFDFVWLILIIIIFNRGRKQTMNGDSRLFWK